MAKGWTAGELLEDLHKLHKYLQEQPEYEYQEGRPVVDIAIDMLKKRKAVA